MDINQLKQHTFIVIGYEHYNPLGVIRSLGENGISPVVIMLKNDVRVASKSKYIKDLYIIDRNEEAFDILKKYVDKKNKAIIIPCDDNITELLDEHYDEIKNCFYCSNAGEAGRIGFYQNKANTNTLAEQCGLKIPQSWVTTNKKIPGNIQYPVITKPLTSYPNWKEDYYICHNDEELQGALDKIKSDTVLLQQFIVKTKEISMDGVSCNKGTEVFISNYNESVYVLEDYFSMMLYHKKLENTELKNKIKKMLETVRYEGIFSVDFIEDSAGTWYFLEINYRNSAFSYASTKLGMNLPLIWASAMVNNKMPEQIERNIPSNYISLAEVADFGHRVRRLKMITFKDWIKDVKRANCLYDYNPNDLKPLISEIVGKAKRIGRKKIKNLVRKVTEKENVGR